MTVPASPRQLLSAQLGIVVPADDAPALLAADGPRFRRLAWTGERMLRALAVRALVADGPEAPALEAALAERVSAEALADGLARTGVLALLPDGARPDQVTPACVATGHRTQGWSGALAVGVRLVDLALGQVRLPKGLAPGVAEVAGRAGVQAAAGLLLAARLPDADVPALDEAAAALPEVPDAALADVGRVLLVRGAQAAVETALPHLRAR